MNIMSRATGILTKPQPEWERIAAEPDTAAGVFTRYAAPMALLPLVGSIVGGLLIGGQTIGAVEITFSFKVISALAGYVVGLALLYIMHLIANALAPSFGGMRNTAGAMKLLAYASTATWVAGLFSFVPLLGFLISLVGLAYAIYLLFLGSTPVMGVPAGKAGGYTAAVAGIWLVTYLVVITIVGVVLVFAVLGGVGGGSF